MLGLTAALLGGQALLQQCADGVLNLGHIVRHITVGQAAVEALLTAREAPDERPVAGVVLLKPSFL